MSWHTPSQFDKELLANLRAKLSPDLLALAQYTALAPRIEPLLLRNMRTAMMPASEPELEHQLWFSNLIAARSSLDIVLNQGVARLLANELCLQDEVLTKVWTLTQRFTAHWSTLDRLELKLRYHALQQDQNAINQGVQEALRAIHQANGEPDKQLELARWAKKTLPSIAAESTQSNEIAWLAQFAATNLGATSGWTKLSASKPIPDWLGVSSLTEQSRIGLQLRYDATLGYQVLECLPATDAAITLPLPTPLPARLYIQPENASEGFWDVINPGVRIKLPQPSRSIELRTIDGKRYELQAEIELPTDNENRQAVNATYLTHVKEDEELARHIAAQLAEQGIQVTLLTESPTEFNRLKSWLNDSSVSKFLRLWTPAAQKQWQPEDWEDYALADSSLLLRWQQAELPRGVAGAGVVDWDDRLSNINPIRQWLSRQTITTETRHDTRWLQQALNDLGASPRLIVDGIDGPATRQALKNFQTQVKLFADGIAGPQTLAAIEQQLALNKLLKELDNPQTTPKRRLAIGDQLAEQGDPRKGIGVIEYEVIEYAPQVQILLDELNDPKTEPPRRLEIGDQLDAMGDPRIGLGLDENGLPDIDWVEIPAGPFIYGENKDQQTLELPAFKISRYPVTNRQFQAFIDAGGYDDPQWWQDLPKLKPQDPSWKQNNRPRESVSWFEAMVFSRWLSAQLGYSVTLPTETQWEKAARGTDGRIFPWGNEYRPGYANCYGAKDDDESFNLQQTTAVGLYPQGDSLFGVADMAGNVWEWCIDDYEMAVDPGTNIRSVLRGGSWFDAPNSLRSANRFRFSADNRSNFIGFRLTQD
jgi:hypothetical protein